MMTSSSTTNNKHILHRVINLVSISPSPTRGKGELTEEEVDRRAEYYIRNKLPTTRIKRIFRHDSLTNLAKLKSELKKLNKNNKFRRTRHQIKVDVARKQALIKFEPRNLELKYLQVLQTIQTYESPALLELYFEAGEHPRINNNRISTIRNEYRSTRNKMYKRWFEPEKKPSNWTYDGYQKFQKWSLSKLRKQAEAGFNDPKSRHYHFEW